MAKLTAASVRVAKCPSHARRPVRFGDGGGLYLQVAPGNTKPWLFRFTLNGRAREMGLGSYLAFGLAEARERATAQRKLLADSVEGVSSPSVSAGLIGASSRSHVTADQTEALQSLDYFA